MGRQEVSGRSLPYDTHACTPDEMSMASPQVGSMARRSFFVRVIAAVHAAIGGVTAYVLGGVLVGPTFTQRDTTWLRAGRLATLRHDRPMTVTLRVRRHDGYMETVEHAVVYLVKSAEGGVRALQSTCTHLGCRTSYDAERHRIVCPCHGGLFDIDGTVVGGPAPRPLAALATKIENGQILVRV